MKHGLILEGGAMRGLFTAGVIDVLMEHNISFDGMIGVSAGAVFGCNYKSCQPGRVLRYNLANCKNPKYCSIRSLIRTGNMFGVDFCYRELPDKLDLFDNQRFADNPMEFYAVATDINTGKAVYHRCDAITPQTMEWFRASASMPLAATIVSVDGMDLLDGGIADSIPIRYFESIGYERNLIVLTQPRSYQKHPASMQGLMKLRYKSYPKLLEAMASRHLDYNASKDWIAKQEKAGSVLVIAPDTSLPIGRIEHDPTKIQETYNLGRRAAEKQLENIKGFLRTETGPSVTE
ncbi:MAG: patatin family protein [Clostridia bacterium]|nr:patatin family protein [Clostridia bacterium]